MRKTRKAARIVWEADRKRVNDRLGADVSLCSAFWSRLSFARSQRGYVAGCGMALEVETSPARHGAFLTISLYSYQGAWSVWKHFLPSVNRFGGRYLS